MSIQAIVGHLQLVAEKEGYKYEPEALNIIAQKADGGMRDALSIFDQSASYTGGDLTYQKVIENLNVLDYEYYFRLTEHFLQNETPQCLLLFNEVTEKGFEGSHFINGLASHLRDLLVSKDDITLPLLEVSDNIRTRYKEQAQRCQPRFLYRAIKLCSDCDLNYRASKNKRLLVEITLIQLSQITQEDDSAGSGRSPEKTLPPLFNKPAAEATQVPTVNPSAPQATMEKAPQTARPAAATNAPHRSPLPQAQEPERPYPQNQLEYAGPVNTARGEDRRKPAGGTSLRTGQGIRACHRHPPARPCGRRFHGDRKGYLLLLA